MMNGGEESDVTQAGERWMREQAVAELKVEKTPTGVKWLVHSRGRQIDRAIAEVLPTERCVNPAKSYEFARTLLSDEVGVRIADSGAVLIGRAGTEEGAGERCPCRGSGDDGAGERYGCLCGCHVGGICRQSIMRVGRGEAPQVSFLFSLQAVPEIGPVFMRSASWALSLWLRELARSGDLRDGDCEAVIRLRRANTRTRSGVEVALTQPVGQRLSWGDSAVPFRLAA
ncbi:hypothetical protein [Streptomyces sindenensis]|uniref:hypothetical protein n=1 Tax=Streptomyces sindenensis TaxID=67363 RepID=UPI00167837D6|nr:hypothetical protein [Streptomyces sindenensis]